MRVLVMMMMSVSLFGQAQGATALVGNWDMGSYERDAGVTRVYEFQRIGPSSLRLNINFYRKVNGAYNPSNVQGSSIVLTECSGTSTVAWCVGHFNRVESKSRSMRPDECHRQWGAITPKEKQSADMGCMAAGGQKTEQVRVEWKNDYSFTIDGDRLRAQIEERDPNRHNTVFRNGIRLGR